MSIKSATGYYINLYDNEGLDLFIILNEPNDEPTTDDYIFIENTVNEHIDRYGYIDEEKLKKILDKHFPGGAQILNKSMSFPKL